MKLNYLFLITVLSLLFRITTDTCAQSVEDLFRPCNVQISWVGIDFSHVKLIGGFTQFFGAGEKSSSQIKDTYFPAWNQLILNEPDKYDLKGMSRKSEVLYDIDMVTALNSKASLEDMEVYNTPKYKETDIQDFVSEYTLKDNGISLVLIAESLNKNAEEAYFHFVAIRNSDKSILLSERLNGQPRGFGLRNYWAGSIYHIFEDIRKVWYKTWKNLYIKK